MLQVCQVGTRSKRANRGIRNSIIGRSVRGSDKLRNGTMEPSPSDLFPALSHTVPNMKRH